MQSNNIHKERYFNYNIFGFVPFIISVVLVLLSVSNISAESIIPKVKLSVKPLDLSHTPTTKELMAAGQLGGQLYPTKDIEIEDKNIQKEAIAPKVQNPA